MTPVDAPPSRRWLPLGRACRLLDVNEATLRQWADSGFVRAFRTPGGHRRFLSDDIHALVESASRPPERDTPTPLDEEALRRVRRRLGRRPLSGLEWYSSLDERSRGRLRLLGRRLLALAARGIVQRYWRDELLEEVRMLGEEYGAEVARRGLSLPCAVEAFVFFRNSALEALRGALRPAGLKADPVARTWRQVVNISDVALVSLLSAYESEDRHATGPRTRSVPSLEAP